MKKVDVSEIMKKLLSESQDQEQGCSSKNQCSPRKYGQSVVETVLDEIQINQMNEEELLGLLRSYNAQFLEISHFKSFEPVFAEYGSLQDELNSNYKILTRKKKFGFIQKIVGKLLGINKVLGLQEQFNAIVTRIINRNIEINTNITHEIYQVRTQLYFLSIQMKICTQLIQRMINISKRLNRELQHMARHDEYVATIIPELNLMYNNLKTLLNQLDNRESLNGH